MYWSSKVLGTGLATELQTRSTQPILTIGSDGFTRVQLAKIRCFSFLAAANLSKKLAALDVKHTRDLYERIPPASLAMEGLGAVSLAVLGAAFEVKGVGGSRPIESWMEKHQDGNLVTFNTVKGIVKKEAAEERGEKKAIEKRTAARKQAAHEIRVERHVKRSNGHA